MGIIYKATNDINGKVYIGQTKSNLDQRRNKHECDAFEHNTPYAFHKALRKYGKDNFSWKILEECDSAILQIREIFYIEQFQSFIGIPNSNGYNMTVGGEGGNTNGDHLEKERIYAQISSSNSGSNHYLNKMSSEEREKFLDTYRRGEHNCMYGVKWSDERKQQKSVIMTGDRNPYYGKNHSPEIRERMSSNGKGKITGEKNPNFGKKGANNTLSKKYVITFQTGIEVVIVGLNEFCNWYKKTTGVVVYSQTLSSVAHGKLSNHKGLKCRHFSENKDNDIMNLQYKDDYDGKDS